MLRAELLLDYQSFKLFTARPNKLRQDEQEWLGRWEAFDLATSPRDDKERSLIRYGHYMGWVHAREFRA